jgi:N-acyl-D-aspartate/D-glutamate deacylase
VHRSKSGELVPGTTAGDDELLGIAAAVQRAGGGTFQFAPEHVRLAVDEWPWMRELARANPDVTVSVNLNQADDGPHIWREVLTLLEEADRDGLRIVAQVAGRSIGMMMCLESSFHPLMFHPAHAEVAHLPFAERLRALRDPARRHRLVHEIPADDGFFEKVVLAKVGKYYPVEGDDVNYEPSAEESVAAISAKRRVPAMEVIVDQMLSRGGKGMIYQPIFNYAYGDLSMTHELSRSPHTRMGLSDAGAHCGAICDAVNRLARRIAVCGCGE